MRRRGSRGRWASEVGCCWSEGGTRRGGRLAERPGDPDSTKQWAPFNLDFERIITAVEGDRVTVGAPVMCAIEKRWGGGEVAPYDDRQRVKGSRVENLRGISAFNGKET